MGTGSAATISGFNSIAIGGGASTFGNSITISRNTIFGNIDGLILSGLAASGAVVTAPSTRISFLSQYWNGSASISAPDIYMRSEATSTTASKWVVYSPTGNIIEGKNTGEVGIGGAAAASAKLDVSSTTQGVLFPRMTTTQRDAITSPAEGLMIYNLTTHKLNLRTVSAWEEVTSL